MAKTRNKVWGVDFVFDTKINTTYLCAHSNAWSLALRSKLGVWQNHMYFKPKNTDFGHLDIRLPRPMCLKGWNETYCEKLWYRVWVIHRKGNLWYRLIFHVDIGQNVIFRSFQKNPFPPLPPCPWCFLWTNMIKICKISKIWYSIFVFQAEIAISRSKMWFSGCSK